jgi:hypothetical protein
MEYFKLSHKSYNEIFILMIFYLILGTKISSAKHGQYAREMATNVESFITTAQSGKLFININ